MAGTEAQDSVLLGALRRYSDARDAALRSARSELELSDTEARALLFVAEHEGSRPSDLKGYLGLSSAAVTTLVDRLERRHALERRPDADDRRVIRLRAVVDLDSGAWSVLRAYDQAIAVAAAEEDADGIDSAAGLIDRVVDAAG